MTIERINPGPHWSQVVIHGDTVYLVGITASDKSQDVKGQTTQVLDNIDALLARAGTDKSKLLTANIWLRDINDWSKRYRTAPAANARGSRWPRSRPGRRRREWPGCPRGPTVVPRRPPAPP